MDDRHQSERVGEREGLRAAVSDGRSRQIRPERERGAAGGGFRRAEEENSGEGRRFGMGTVRREFRERERGGALGGNEISFPLQPVLTEKKKLKKTIKTTFHVSCCIVVVNFVYENHFSSS
jgi:hypothetical protein